MADDGPFGPVVNGTQIHFYEYRPNKIAGLTFVGLFAAIVIAHLIYLFILRAWSFIPLILGGICEIAGYYGRAASHDDPASTGPFIMQNVLLLAGPPFIAATIYMSLGRIAMALESRTQVRWMTKIYVLVDIACIFSQFIGALMPVSGDAKSMERGRKILIAGLVTQLTALSFFILTTWYIYRQIKKHPSQVVTEMRRPRFKIGAYFGVLAFASFLMLIRSLIRSIEFLQGPDGYILAHEIFIYLCDATLIFIIMVLLIVIYPAQLTSHVQHRKAMETEPEQNVMLNGWRNSA